MALLFECMGKCCRNMLDTADIVRDAWLQQLKTWLVFAKAALVFRTVSRYG